MIDTPGVPSVRTAELTSGVLRQMVWTLLFAGVTAVSARLEIPHQPVPYTLQTLVVLLAGAFLGARNGAISQILYVAAGALGAPVFAGGAAGAAVLAGPTGGYLAGFPVAAALAGYLVGRRRTLPWCILSMTLGALAIFTLGTAHLYAFWMHSVASAISAGFLIFSWWDLLKILAAAMTYHELAKRWPKVG